MTMSRENLLSFKAFLSFLTDYLNPYTKDLTLAINV
jgi:hypothetical protein